MQTNLAGSPATEKYAPYQYETKGNNGSLHGCYM